MAKALRVGLKSVLGFKRSPKQCFVTMWHAEHRTMKNTRKNMSTEMGRL